MKIRFRHIIIGWLAFAVVMTIVMYIVHPPASRDFNFLSELKWETAFALVWIPATPFVLWFSRRYSLAGGNTLRNIGVLALAGVLLSAVLCFAHSAIAFALNPGTNGYTSNVILYSFYYTIDKMLIIYFALVIFRQALTYYEEMREKELKTSRLQTQLSRAQMQALKMQLQPHFLFNTFNAVVTLVHKDPDAAEEMIVRLSHFLRMTLDAPGKDFVTLKEELEFIRSYLDIEQVRFEGKLRYTHSVPPHLLEVRVPLLVLLPLVENAVKHGISRYDHAHSVEIVAAEKHGSLVLVVSDDGIPADALNESMAKEGIGLQNTRQRLETMYGADATVAISSNGAQGLRVELYIPLQTEDR